MRSKLAISILILGLVCLSATIVILTRNLFNMPVRNAGTTPTVQVPDSSQQTLVDAAIEVGSETEKKGSGATGKPIKVSRYSSGNESPVSKKADVSISEMVGKVSYVAGLASVVNKGGTTRLLGVNADIFRMDRIETGPAAKLEIKFIDGTIVSQGEKSVIVIEECLYTPTEPANCNFVLRFTRGICRVVTGFITDINPDRFKVRAKMATVGIRGCELVFRSTQAQNDIFVLDLGRAKSVQIETTSNGSTVNNLETGSELPINNSIKRQISITEPKTMLSLAEGKEPQQHNIGMDEARGLITETSNMTPARYELQQTPGGATLKILPVKPSPKTSR